MSRDFTMCPREESNLRHRLNHNTNPPTPKAHTSAHHKPHQQHDTNNHSAPQHPHKLMEKRWTHHLSRTSDHTPNNLIHRRPLPARQPASFHRRHIRTQPPITPRQTNPTPNSGHRNPQRTRNPPNSLNTRPPRPPRNHIRHRRRMNPRSTRQRTQRHPTRAINKTSIHQSRQPRLTNTNHNNTSKTQINPAPHHTEERGKILLPFSHEYEPTKYPEPPSHD